MISKLTQPGEQHSKEYGTITLVASLCVGGGVALNTFAGPTRIDELSGLRFTNRLDAAEVYRDIRDAGLADVSIPGIAERVRERLVGIAAPLRGRADQEPRVAELDAALDRVEALAFTSTLSDRTFATLRDEFAAGMAHA
ncbi:hypothetical protein E1211_17890 [Micromonospora sp. 15K316]|uniref:hypothetical protein n=1 Tax=Micromonospora sp. 15K316 TaxID=2530376 RepID=UPI001048C8E1|nr:hypothetical protein [Micromonospora sp. 15K316]TDC34219.1 hypothetical protein E1211_17890 [Micromonospora sp. 15K316]